MKTGIFHLQFACVDYDFKMYTIIIINFTKFLGCPNEWTPEPKSGSDVNTVTHIVI